MKSKVFFSSLKQALFSKMYILSIIGTILMCYISSKDYLVDGSNIGSIYIIELMINLSMFKKIIVFFSALPFVATFCKEYNSGYINSIVYRCTEKNYIISKVLSCSISGFCSVFMGILIYFSILSLIYPIKGYETNEPYAMLALDSPIVYLLIIISVFSIYATVWAISGLAISSILPNNYVALGSPVIFGYILEELTYRMPQYFNLYKLSHCYKVFGDTVISNYLYTILVFIIFIIAFGCVFSYFVKRRIRNEMF